MEKLTSPEGDTMSNIGFSNPSWLSADKKILRRPHIASANKTPNISQEEEPLESSNIPNQLKEINSNLSIDAVPFYPRKTYSRGEYRIKMARETTPNVNYEQIPLKEETQPPSEAAQQLDSSNNSNASSQDKNFYPEGQETSTKEENDNDILQELEVIIYAITAKPGEFLTFIPGFVSEFWEDNNIRCLPVLLKTIIDWSVIENNFRYNGARICTYFDTIAKPEKRLLFRDVLYYSCQMEIRLQEFEWTRDWKHNSKCHGLILFLAELVAQMDESFASSLGELLIEFITKILNVPASHIVKYICQALKLAGQRLEKDKSKSAKLENMMQALTLLVTRDQVDTQVGSMVHSVQKLRNDNWGAANSDSSKTNNAVSDTQSKRRWKSSNKYLLDRRFTVTEQVPPPVSETTSREIYEVHGPEGQIELTQEEAEFLESHLGHDEIVLQDLDIDPHYDSEIADAFETFCDMSKKQ